MEQDLLIKVLLSTVLGFLGGWLVKSVFAGSRLRGAERQWQVQMKTSIEARDAAALKVRQLRSQLGEMETSFANVEKDMTKIRDSMEQRERSIHGLREDLTQAKGKIEETQKLRAALLKQEEKLKKYSGIRAELLKTTAQRSELEAARLELATVLQRATQLEYENAELNETTQQLKDRIQQLTSDQAALLKAASDTPPASAQQADQSAKIGQLEAQLKARDHTLSQLQRDYAQVKELAEQQPASSTGVDELQRRLATRDQTIAELYDQLDTSRGLLSELQQRINLMEQEQRRRSLEPKPSNQTHDRNPIEPPQPSRLTAGQLPATEVPLFYDRPPQQIDDLTEIKGIGEVLATNLNAMGIFQFAQLARLNDEDIERVTRRLRGFKDRIHRDRWIEQAADLLKR